MLSFHYSYKRKRTWIIYCSKFLKIGAPSIYCQKNRLFTWQRLFPKSHFKIICRLLITAQGIPLLLQKCNSGIRPHGLGHTETSRSKKNKIHGQYPIAVSPCTQPPLGWGKIVIACSYLPASLVSLPFFRLSYRKRNDWFWNIQNHIVQFADNWFAHHFLQPLLLPPNDFGWKHLPYNYPKAW